MRKGGESKIPFCHPRGLRAFTQTYHERDDVIKFVWSVCRWLSQWWLIFSLLDWTLMLLWVWWVWEFNNTCTVWGKWNVSKGFSKTLWMRTPALAVRVQLPLGWNTYLLFNTDIVNFAWKTDDGEAKSIVLLIFVLCWCLNLQWMRGGGVGQKVLFRAS